MGKLATIVAEKVEEIISCYHQDDIHLTEILHSIQEEFHYIPKDVLPLVAERLDTSESIVVGVVNFYSEFVLEPQGKYIIKVCEGSSCVTAGSEGITEMVMNEISKHNQNVNGRPLFAIERVVCLGKCNTAPNICINSRFYTSMTPQKVTEVLDELSLKEKNGTIQKAS